MSALDKYMARYNEFGWNGVVEDEKRLALRELKDLRAKAARCDAYEREGEALIPYAEAMAAYDENDRHSAGVDAITRAQLARDRARVEAAIQGWYTSNNSERSLVERVREALQ